MIQKLRQAFFLLTGDIIRYAVNSVNGFSREDYYLVSVQNNHTDFLSKMLSEDIAILKEARLEQFDYLDEAEKDMIRIYLAFLEIDDKDIEEALTGD